MKQQDLRRWIEAGYRDYGEDPWFFIRELAQNSRDAGARVIHVKAGWTTAGEEIVEFQDDGRGMTYDDAVRYLFRLYASSKTGNKNAAGMFGIGFWTVMRFQPRRVMIESRVGNERWGVWVDEQLQTVPFNSRMERGGTRITLIRPIREKNAAIFEKKVRDAVERYCVFLRRNNRRADPLPVFFGGKNMTSRMQLPGPVSLSFKTGGVEGAVGLGEKPRVRLYARGLPVWEGTSLDELSHKPPDNAGQSIGPQDIGRGLAPVFLLNGNHLEVNISRRKVIDNRHLQNVKTTGQKALSRMVEMAADWVVPRSFFHRLGWRIKTKFSRLFNSFLRSILTLLILIIPVEIYIITHLFKSEPGLRATASVSLRAGEHVYDGASVRAIDNETGGVDGDGIRLTYTPADDQWFKIFNAESYRLESGFVQVMEAVPGSGTSFGSAALPELDCGSGRKIGVRLTVKRPGRIFLPLVHGYYVESDSLRLNGESLEPDQYRPGDLIVVTLPTGGRLDYSCCPAVKFPPPNDAELKRLAAFPQGLKLPPEIDRKLRGNEHLPLSRKIDTSVRLTVSYLSYDNSIETARKYAETGSGNWLENVLALRVGDCDVINGVTALFLRRMGVPSRLAIGLVGKQGRVLPGLHAWTEYFDPERQTFNVVDTSAFAPSLEKKSPPETGTARREPFPADSGSPSRYTVSGGTRTVLFGLLAVLIVIMAVLSVKLFRMRRKENGHPVPDTPGDLNRVRENLADMLLHALLHPGVWGRESGIRHFRVIPTIYGSAVSLSTAVSLGKQRKLFALNKNHPLARFLVQLKKSPHAPILDSGNAAFGPLIRLLPGTVHLERILALKVDRWDRNTPAHREIDALLASVNIILARLDRRMPVILAAPGLESDDIYDVDLSLLPNLESWGMPNRFIAVSPFGSRIVKWSSLSRDNLPLAQFRLIDTVLRQSRLIPVPVEKWREDVARRLLKQVGER